MSKPLRLYENVDTNCSSVEVRCSDLLYSRQKLRAGLRGFLPYTKKDFSLTLICSVHW